jgi:hypothetical protein
MRFLGKIQHLFLMAMIGTFVLGVTIASAQVTEEQIQILETAIEDGDDVSSVAQGILSEVTNALVASGLTGDELSSQISIALNELAAVVPPGESNMVTLVEAIFQGGTTGVVEGVNLAVGENSTEAQSLVSSATAGAAGAVSLFTATNPAMDAEVLVSAVETGATTAGAAPPEPEAYEPAGEPPAESASSDPGEEPPAESASSEPAGETPAEPEAFEPAEEPPAEPEAFEPAEEAPAAPTPALPTPPEVEQPDPDTAASPI